MAIIDFNYFRDPVGLLHKPRSKRGRLRNAHSKHNLQLVQQHRKKTQEQQQKWLEHVQHILRDTFPSLKVSRDLTNLSIPQYLEILLTRTCFYRGLVVPGLIYAFNFTLPSEQTLRSELLLHMPFDYRIKDHLYVQTAGRFDLELFRHPEPLHTEPLMY